MKIRLCFLSPPGSGKGTICKLICQSYPNVKHFDVGQMLRDKKDETIYQVQKQGGLVDSNNVLTIFNQALACDQFILDGSPRKENEAEHVLNHQNWISDPGYLIKINTPKQVCINRLLKRGRFDDTPEAIEKRFEMFEQETMRSIELFKQKDRLIEIGGCGSPEDIFIRIVAEISLKETIENYHKGSVSEESFDPNSHVELLGDSWE